MKTRVVTFFLACLAVCFVTLGCGSKKAESSSDEAQQEESAGTEAAQPAEEHDGDHKDGDSHNEGEGQEDQHDEADDSSKESAMRYHCPMKCGGDMTFAEAGNCPACGMELAMVQSAQ